VEHGQIALRREQSARLLACGIRFFLSATLTASQTAGEYAPFALGCMAAAGTGIYGAAALAGNFLGALLFLEFEAALPHMAVAVLILTAATAFRGSALLGKPKALSVAAGAVSLAVGGIYVVQSLSPAEEMAPCLAAAGLTAVSAWFFTPLLQPEEGRTSVAGVLFLSAALALSLQGVTVAEISLGRVLLGTLLLYAAYEHGAPTGAAAGLGLGLTVDLSVGSGSGIFAAGLGLAGLLAGGRQGSRRSVAALIYFVAVLVTLLPVKDPLAQPMLAEAALSAVCFLLLPGRLFGGKRIRRPETESAAGGQVKERLNQAAAALRDLYESLGRAAPVSTEENPAIVFDRAAERVCRGCALCDLCWQKEYTGTFNALNDATPFLLERGRAMNKDFPQYFLDRCIHLPEFLAAVNGELSAYLLRRQYRRQMEETRRTARGQYAQLSELLTATAASLGETVSAQREEDACRVGAVLRAKDGEKVCGDTVASFRCADGAWCLLLADGMGSGEAARRESALICRLLQQFLEAGIEAEAALKTLNAAMALRGAETGSFTTIDLCVFRPGDGEAVFYKYGAAPSYLKKGGRVRRVTGNSLPAGLRGSAAPPDVTRIRLEHGGFAVLISDGVADAGHDEWLQDLLAGWEGDDPQILAGLILSESRRREQLRDDCAVQVLYRPENDLKEV